MSLLKITKKLLWGIEKFINKCWSKIQEVELNIILKKLKQYRFKLIKLTCTICDLSP